VILEAGPGSEAGRRTATACTAGAGRILGGSVRQQSRAWLVWSRFDLPICLCCASCGARWSEWAADLPPPAAGAIPQDGVRFTLAGFQKDKLQHSGARRGGGDGLEAVGLCDTMLSGEDLNSFEGRPARGGLAGAVDPWHPNERDEFVKYLAARNVATGQPYTGVPPEHPSRDLHGHSSAAAEQPTASMLPSPYDADAAFEQAFSDRDRQGREELGLVSMDAASSNAMEAPDLMSFDSPSQSLATATASPLQNLPSFQAHTLATQGPPKGDSAAADCTVGGHANGSPAPAQDGVGLLELLS
jgi:hypothetical protein